MEKSDAYAEFIENVQQKHGLNTDQQIVSKHIFSTIKPSFEKHLFPTLRPVVEKVINPCPYGQPIVSNVYKIVAHCSLINQHCEVGWCHLGKNFIHNVCCPYENNKVEDFCSIGKEIGHGTEKLTRWFYNSNEKQCQSFIYSGLGGRSFISKSLCESQCPVLLQNPCLSGLPFYEKNANEPLYCSTADEINVCPEGHWCHIGSSASTTLCCPFQSDDPCELPLAKGNGTSVLNRFYFNSKLSLCLPFIYTGLGANVNNFLSLQDCVDTCKQMINPCLHGLPHISENGFTNCGNYEPSCPPFFFCSFSSLEKNVCCPLNDESTCDMPMEEGIGESSSARCELTTVCCKSLSNDICKQKLNEGNGPSSLLRYYFDQFQCLPFTYLGSKGNSNNFLSLEACQRTCNVSRVNPCFDGQPATSDLGEVIRCANRIHNNCPKKTHFCHFGDDSDGLCCPGETEDVCNLDLHVGTGDLLLARWYFDRRVRRCLMFEYSGAGGNANSFDTFKECKGKFSFRSLNDGF
uniref:Kunitz/Bovine pancreatic trypsin inhibitor domain protein n=1 Tax=Rhabditophanes sp. KR3021 TaxID=114890 RepID=A0AC35UHM0_9BILA